MGISELVFNKKSLKSKKDILDILRKLELYWLIDSECEGACIEIEKNTVIWHSGLYLTGDWNFGIFLNGDFRGNWINGIWSDGTFDSDVYQKVEISRGIWTLSKKINHNNHGLKNNLFTNETKKIIDRRMSRYNLQRPKNINQSNKNWIYF